MSARWTMLRVYCCIFEIRDFRIEQPPISKAPTLRNRSLSSQNCSWRVRCCNFKCTSYVIVCISLHPTRVAQPFQCHRVTRTIFRSLQDHQIDDQQYTTYRYPRQGVLAQCNDVNEVHHQACLNTATTTPNIHRTDDLEPTCALESVQGFLDAQLSTRVIIYGVLGVKVVYRHSACLRVYAVFDKISGAWPFQQKFRAQFMRYGHQWQPFSIAQEVFIYQTFTLSCSSS